MEIIGHRGQVLAGGPSENTLAAVTAAHAEGADGVEIDVRLTRDGVAVCLHDADLSRLAGIATPIDTLTHADLADVRLPSGHRIARLDEMAAASAGKRLVIAELKHEGGCPAALVTAAMASFARARIHDNVVVSSFSLVALAEARRQVPSIRRALVSGPGARVADSLTQAMEEDHHELHAWASEVIADPAVAGMAHRRDRVMRCWTVNRRQDAVRLEAAGVAALITDDPGRMIRDRRSPDPAIRVRSGGDRRRQSRPVCDAVDAVSTRSLAATVIT